MVKERILFISSTSLTAPGGGAEELWSRASLYLCGQGLRCFGEGHRIHAATNGSLDSRKRGLQDKFHIREGDWQLNMVALCRRASEPLTRVSAKHAFPNLATACANLCSPRAGLSRPRHPQNQVRRMTLFSAHHGRFRRSSTDL